MIANAGLRASPLRAMIVAVAAGLSAACTSPPKAPTVDDSNKRPVNSTQAIELQSCRGELSAAKVVLFEATHDEARRMAMFAASQCNAVMAKAPAPEGNRVFVVPFKTGSHEFFIPPEHEQRFLSEVGKAKFILIRARTDASRDSMAETELARRRADSALRYIMAKSAKLPRDGIRLTWQGAGDSMPASLSLAARAGGAPITQASTGAGAGVGTDSSALATDRRVEIEIYTSLPEYEVLVSTGRLDS